MDSYFEFARSERPGYRLHKLEVFKLGDVRQFARQRLHRSPAGPKYVVGRAERLWQVNARRCIAHAAGTASGSQLQRGCRRPQARNVMSGPTSREPTDAQVARTIIVAKRGFSGPTANTTPPCWQPSSMKTATSHLPLRKCSISIATGAPRRFIAWRQAKRGLATDCSGFQNHGPAAQTTR